MTTITNGHLGATAERHSTRKHDGGVQRLLRDLNSDYRETISALMGAHASINRALKLTEENYQRKRRQILNGHDESRSEELRT